MMIEASKPAKLAGVGRGDIVFVGHYHEVLRPVQVEKVGKIHITAGGKKYAISNGARAGEISSGRVSGYGHVRACPYSEALWDAHEIHRLKQELARELGAFQARPEIQTQERLLALLRILNPEAWK